MRCHADVSVARSTHELHTLVQRGVIQPPTMMAMVAMADTDHDVRPAALAPIFSIFSSKKAGSKAASPQAAIPPSPLYRPDAPQCCRRGTSKHTSRAAVRSQGAPNQC